jgi:hypothetical protein
VVDAANLERRGLPSVVIGLPQLLETVGRATAEALNATGVPFVHVPGDLHHALDYVPDDSEFWATCIEELAPRVVKALTTGTGDTA